jgi:hypothetical protein
MKDCLVSDTPLRRMLYCIAVLKQDVSLRSKARPDYVIHRSFGSKGKRLMETRILIGYGLLGCAVLAVLAGIVNLMLRRWRMRQRRKQLWQRYYK